jgi:hypothetical protein
MICPKCRTKYPDSITVCPECGVELIGLLGAADAPMDDGAAVQELVEEIVVDKNDEYSPVVYKVNERSKERAKQTEKETDDGEYYEPAERGSGNSLAVFMFVMAILFLCAGGVMLFLGQKAEPQQTSELIKGIFANLIG